MAARTLTIERDKWWRGTAERDAVTRKGTNLTLLDFVLLRLGLSREEIEHLHDALEVAEDENVDLLEEDREQSVTLALRDAGFEPLFIGEKAPQEIIGELNFGEEDDYTDDACGECGCIDCVCAEDEEDSSEDCTRCGNELDASGECPFCDAVDDDQDDDGPSLTDPDGEEDGETCAGCGGVLNDDLYCPSCDRDILAKRDD
ncbi:MAG TPA: hypothetical protein VEI97_09825 [bacterium]|nr:hypothetical protein [bacterium]